MDLTRDSAYRRVDYEFGDNSTAARIFRDRGRFLPGEEMKTVDERIAASPLRHLRLNCLTLTDGFAIVGSSMTPLPECLFPQSMADSNRFC
jgi:hypothetical protein